MNIVWYKYRWVQVQSSYIWCNENDVVVYYYICPSLGRLIRVDDCEEWYHPFKFLLIFILATIFFMQCEKPKENLRVPYNPLCKDIPLQNNNNVKATIDKDWSEDSTMTDRKRETLNEILAR